MGKPEVPGRVWIPGDHNLAKATLRGHGDYYTSRNWPDDIEYAKVPTQAENQDEGKDARPSIPTNTNRETVAPPDAWQPMQSDLRRVLDLLDPISTVSLSVRGLNAEANAISKGRVILDSVLDRFSQRCAAFKPNILGAPEREDRCTKPANHVGKHSLPTQTAPRNNRDVSPHGQASNPTERQMYDAAVRAGVSSAVGRTFEEWREKVSDYGLDDAEQAWYAERPEVAAYIRGLSDAANAIRNLRIDGRFSGDIQNGYYQGTGASEEACVALISSTEPQDTSATKG